MSFKLFKLSKFKIRENYFRKWKKELRQIIIHTQPGWSTAAERYQFKIYYYRWIICSFDVFLSKFNAVFTLNFWFQWSISNSIPNVNDRCKFSNAIIIFNHQFQGQIPLFKSNDQCHLSISMIDRMCQWLM